VKKPGRDHPGGVAKAEADFAKKVGSEAMRRLVEPGLKVKGMISPTLKRLAARGDKGTLIYVDSRT
jgi:hypothetical protein